MAWEITDLNNTELTNGAIDNAKCGLILRNSISENRVAISNIHNYLFEDGESIQNTG